MTDYKTIAIAVLAGIVIYMLVHSCDDPKPSPVIQQNLDSISVKKAISAAVRKAGEEIRQKMAVDSGKNESVLKRKEMAISTLQGKLAAAVARRPTVIRDTIYLLQDSVIQEQAGTITHLKGEIDTLRTDYGKLLRLKETEIRVKSEMFDHLTAINTELYKSLNKERRRGKLWKYGLPAAFVVGFVIGNEL